jgi:hypothetical protein
MGWYDDGSEEQFQMEQRSRQAAQAEEAARLAKCEGCKRKLPINELGEHYEHSAWIHDVRTPHFPRQAFRFTSCANWTPKPAPTVECKP